MMKIEGKYLLALNAHPRVGSQTIKKVLQQFPDGNSFWLAPETKVRSLLEGKIADILMGARQEYDPEAEQEKLKKYDIGYITIYDKSFPGILKELPDCPAILYVKGDIDALNNAHLAVVGSREYTYYGKRVTERLVTDCVGASFSIVSGLALGIDGIAHETALGCSGITVAVLPGGLDKVYPSSHQTLAHRIIASGGALISEYPPGTQALRQNFPARNRIIAGLSLGTLVVEAGEGSGTLITANCALDYNREVFAVPGNIDSANSFGTNLLIKQGAKLTASIDDILEELPIAKKKSQQEAKKIIPETEEERTILELLAKGESDVNYLVSKLKFNVIALNSALTIMEMKGMIENIGGGRYRKIC